MESKIYTQLNRLYTQIHGIFTETISPVVSPLRWRAKTTGWFTAVIKSAVNLS